MLSDWYLVVSFYEYLYSPGKPVATKRNKLNKMKYKHRRKTQSISINLLISELFSTFYRMDQNTPSKSASHCQLQLVTEITLYLL